MCARPRGAAVRRVLWPTNEYEYDGVWNEACARELSVFPTTTGVPPHEFHTYLNQQDEVLGHRLAVPFVQPLSGLPIQTPHGARQVAQSVDPPYQSKACIDHVQSVRGLGTSP